MKHTGGIPQSILAKLDTAFGGFSEEQRAHLVELGLLKKNEKRSGVLRFRDSLNLSKVEAKTLGIHPNEASLILRWEANKKISWDRYLNQAAKSSGSKVIEQFNAIDEESKAIDLEWSCLNNQFMDDFYEVEALQVSKEDVWLKYFPLLMERNFQIQQVNGSQLQKNGVSKFLIIQSIRFLQHRPLKIEL